MPPITRAQTGSSQPRSKTNSSSHEPHNASISQQRQRQRHKPPPATSKKYSQIFKSTHDEAPSSLEPSDSSPNEPLELPHFTIDLSLPPEQRYTEVCAALQDEMRGIEALFGDVMKSVVTWVPTVVLRWVCWALLWRVHSAEESAELKGISKATGIDMYLLVCFNVILDLLMGCSSGGAAVRDETGTGTKMVHFRTLDWGMDPLRRVLVRLDYVLEPQGEIVASSISYAGFVGVLTGVRKGLSLSLNFRGVHNGSGELVANARYYGYVGMVFLGLRPSISSTLRRYLISGVDGKSGQRDIASLPDFEAVVEEMSCKTRPLMSSACYLCFSSGRETAVIEKDLNTAKLSSSTSFIVKTNADTDTGEDDAGAEAEEESDETDDDDDDDDDAQAHLEANPVAHEAASPATALEELLQDANERKACAERNYRKLVRRSQLSRVGGDRKEDAKSSITLPAVDDIVDMVQKYPTSNECTHYAAVMDPIAGKFAWCRFWRRPIEC